MEANNQQQFTEITGVIEAIEPKPGPKTTELYVIIGGALLSVAVGAGWLTTDQSQAVTDAVAQTVDALTHLATVLAPLVAAVTYTWSRTRVKAR